MDVNIRLPKLFPWQEEFSQISQHDRLAICSRQSGKTTVCKSIAIRELLAGRRVLWCAPTFPQLTENYDEIRATVGELIKRTKYPREIEIVTGGKVFFRSADKPDSMRGLKAIDLAIFDEFAFADERSYAIIRPMLTTCNGRFIGISTPNGHNHFHDLYMKATQSPDSWFVAKYDWTCSPLLTPDKIKEEQAKLSPQEFRQEYCGDFVSGRGSLFDPFWLKDIFVDEMPTTYQRCIIGTDTSLGELRSDLQACVCAMWANNTLYCDVTCGRMNIETFHRQIKATYEKYRPEAIGYETNAFQSLACHNLRKLWSPNPLPPIIEVNNTVKKEIRISRLASLLAKKQLKLLNNSGGIEAFNELSDFPSPKSKKDVLDAIEQAWRCMIEI